MGVTGWLKPLFIVVNFIFWALGLFLVGYISWTMATNPNLVNSFTSGTRYFAYTILTVGILITLVGLMGCIGALAEGSCLLKTYIIFVVLIVLIEVAGGLTAYFMRDQLEVFREVTWMDFNNDTKFFIQKELQCCGYNSSTDYGTDVTTMPDSCFPPGAAKNLGNLYTDVCLTKMLNWLASNTAIWAGTVSGVGVVEILVIIIAACMVHRIRKASKVSAGSDRGWTEYDRRAAERQYRNQPNYNKSSF